MPVEASSLIARVGADTSQAQSDLRRFGDAVTQAGSEAQSSAARVERLSTTLNLQERELQQLSQRHADAIASNGLFDASTQQLQLRIDRLTASIQNNETVLQIEQQRLGGLVAASNDAGEGFDLFGNIVTGAARKLGELGIDAVVNSFQQLGGVVKDFIATGVESYGTNERITQSYQSLVAVELQRTNSTLSQAQAMEQASGRAQELVAWNQQLAINSPFSEQEAAKATQLALAYGFNSTEAQRLTQVLTDTTAATGGTGDGMERVARAMGQIEARGKTSAQEFNQLSEAGINARQILADAFNVPIANIDKMNEAGELTADKVIPALVDGLDAKFGGAAKRQSETVQGLGNSLQDLYAIAARDVLGPAIEAVKPAVAELVQTLQDPKTRAEMHELGVELGTIARDALPQIIQAGKDFLGVIGPTVELVQTAGIPAIVGLGTAYTVSLVPAIYASIPAFTAQAAAAFAANAPLVLIAGSIAAVGIAAQRLDENLDNNTQRVLDNNKAYGESTLALEAYGNASQATQQKLQPYHAAIEREREIIEEQTRALAGRLDLGNITQAQYEQAQRVINAHINTLDNLNKGIHEEQASAEASTSQYALYAQQQQTATDSTQKLADATKELTDKQREQATQKLQQTIEKADDTSDQRDEAERTYQAAQQQRILDHNAKLSAIDRTAHTDQIAAQQQTQAASQAAYSDYTGKLESLQTAFNAKRTESDYDNGQRLLASETQRTEALADILLKRNDQTDQFNQARAQKEQDFQQRIGEVQRTEGERQTADLASLNQKLSDLDDQRTDAITQANADRAAENDAYQQRLSDATDAYNAKEQEASYKLNAQRDAAQQSYQGKVRDSNQQTLDAYDSYNDARVEREIGLSDKLIDVQEGLQQKYLDIQEGLQQKTIDIQEGFAQKLVDIQEGLQQKVADIQQNLQQKLGDLRVSVAVKQEDAATDYGDSKDDREQSHTDKLIDLQKALTRETSAQGRLRIQQQINDENERYAEAEARAERDYQKKIERAQRDEQRAEEQAKREAARAEQQAQEQAARAEAQAQQAAQRAEAQAQQEAARQEVQAQQAAQRAEAQAQQEAQRAQARADRDYADTVAALERKREIIDQEYQQQQERITQAAEHEREQRRTAYDEQIADLNTKHTTELESIETKTNTEISKIEAQAQKEREDYATRENDAKAHYDRALGDLQAAHTKELGALDAKYRAEQEKLDRAVKDAGADFAERERKAKESYDHELANQTAALNQQRTDAAKAYDDKRKDLQTKLDDQLKTIKQHHDDATKAENKGFQEQFAQAQTAYAVKRQQLTEALAKELVDIAEQQQAITKIYGEEAVRRITIAAIEQGQDANTAQQNAVNQINNININGNLINQQDVGDWIADVLNKRDQNNGNTLNSGAN